MQNIRSLRPKSASIRNHKNLNDSDVLLFTETQISHDANCEEVEYNIRPFKCIFNNDADKFRSLAIGYKEPVVKVLEDQHTSGFSLVSLRKSVFCDRVFKILLLYRSHRETTESFFEKLCRILQDQPDIDFIMGDFNIDLLKYSRESEVLETEHLLDFTILVDKSTHIDGGLIDHVYIRSSLHESFQFEINGAKYCTNLSDHDIIKLEIVKN